MGNYSAINIEDIFREYADKAKLKELSDWQALIANYEEDKISAEKFIKEVQKLLNNET